ncbi:efflux RND transporter permease subunit [Luteimonas sp. SDU101]|uniref:efflux RND transporter permease subunit n=1 Tax=Luteimonas sp. SDU101 TaxID=3422593 RepID=UPI003EBD152C
MKLSDISIKRPVFAVVVSLLLVVLGLMSFSRLTLRELPNIDPPIVSVEVNYPGASAAVVETRVTQILEDALSGIEGINTIQSSSRNGRADVTIEFNLTRDIEAAANDVRDRISRVMDRMPDEADPPEVSKVEADADVIIWLNMRSTAMDTMELTDYADRYVVDRLSALDGVARVQLGGSQRYAMRIWLDRDAMAARGITAADVENALRSENVELPAGRIESETRDFTLRVERGYRQPEQFAQLPLRKGDDGYVVRLGDVATVELGAEERRSYLRSNGVPNVGLGIVRTSTANALDVARAARAEAELIQQTLPEGTDIFVAYDGTTFIDASIKRVYWTLGEAMVLVFLVIWLFLGSLRAALIPAVTVPVCLIAAFIALYAFGFSINLLTLLALVLCIGLVVDDAIIVLENAQRRVDLGEPPLVAARRGTSQVAFAVIATTAVLVAVFLPVGFMDGNTGRLFRELSVALAGAVALSAFVALTLTPMMCSKLLRPHGKVTGFNAWMNRQLTRVSTGYGRRVGRLVALPGGRLLALVLAAMAACALVAALLFLRVPSELAPAEDRGRFFIMVDGPEGAGFDYTVSQIQQVEQIVLGEVGEGKPIQRANSRVPRGWGGSEEMHTGQVIVFLEDWDVREQGTDEVVAGLRRQFADLPGVQVRANVPGGLVGSRGQRYQLVLGGPDYAELAQWRDRVLERMEANPGIQDPDSDYKETRPQMRVQIDRARAADLGVSVTEIGRTLETMMGSRRVTTYVDNGEEYEVMVQAGREARMTPADLGNTYVRGGDGGLVPMSNLVTLEEIAEPGSFNRFNRLRAITISAGLAPGYSMGEAIEWTQRVVEEELPDYAQIDWKGETREYQRAGGAVLVTFAMALLIVYLVLAAQFESFIHPLVIMLTVPLAVLGALIGLWATGGTLNLFSQIGIVMLVGLAAKNGILIVEFANQLRDEGMGVREAIAEASAVRLRPILMTSAATVMGAVPLVVAGGPGSASRATIGVVIIFGVSFATLLSLFVVPAFYALLAPFTRSPDALAKKLERLEAETAPVSGHA